jgi:hypothetical protein
VRKWHHEIFHVMPVPRYTQASKTYCISKCLSVMTKRSHSLRDSSECSTVLPGLFPLCHPGIFASPSSGNTSGLSIYTDGRVSSSLLFSIGTVIVVGMRCAFEAESHSCWQRKTMREIKGISVEMMLGRHF